MVAKRLQKNNKNVEICQQKVAIAFIITTQQCYTLYLSYTI